MAVMEFLPKIPLKIFKVIPSSLLAIISAIVLEFAVVRNMGARTATIRDVSEFTLDTAFPIPFFISTDAVSHLPRLPQTSMSVFLGGYVFLIKREFPLDREVHLAIINPKKSPTQR